VKEIATWAYTAVSDEEYDILKNQPLNPALSFETIIGFSSDAAPTLRAKAVEQIGKSKNRKYVPRIIEMIENDPNIRVVRAALQAFVIFSDEPTTMDRKGIEGAEKWWAKHKSEYTKP
jgi:HEAT repeat protein